jgi:hypothetical protein
MTRGLLKATIIAVLLASSWTSHAQTCAGFTDVLASDPFCPYVEWLRNRSITTGCNLPGTLYCPADGVSRLAMAAFMNRMGKALTPDVQYVDQNPGPVSIQSGNYLFVCPTTPYTVSGFPRQVVANGLAYGIVDAPVSWSADLWYSTDNGATFSYMMIYPPAQTATTAGMLTSQTAFARMDLAVGQTYIFALLIRESVDLPGGSGNFSDLACQVMVQIGNRNSVTSPRDEVERAPVRAGMLRGNVQ